MLRSKRLSGLLLCAVLSMVTNGCARGYISEESISKIRSIEIDTHVAIPHAPDVDGAINVTNNLFVGLMTGSSPMPRNVGASFGAYMDRTGIRMDQIVLRTFRRNLDAQGYFEVREDADATLELAVLRYGFKMPAFDVTNESWEFAPSRNPGELRKMCTRDVGCVYE